MSKWKLWTVNGRSILEDDSDPVAEMALSMTPEDQSLQDANARLIAEVAAKEREACARVAETHEWFVGGIGTKAPGSGESKAIAAAIRARKEL